MATTFAFRRAFRVLLPATLLLAACGKDDKPAAPAPDRAKVLLSHAAAAANTQITAFVNDQQVGLLNYGQSSAYLDINAGTPTLRINNGTQVVATQPLTLAKDQNYTVFAYSPTATIGGNVMLLPVADDLTAPAAGTAKVRLVHLGVGAPTPVRLTIPAATPTGSPTDLTADVAFGSASPFVVVNAASLNLSVTTATTPRTVVAPVGDGTGTGTATTKAFETGKIYTIVVRGIAGTAIPQAQQLQVVIIGNN